MNRIYIDSLEKERDAALKQLKAVMEDQPSVEDQVGHILRKNGWIGSGNTWRLPTWTDGQSYGWGAAIDHHLSKLAELEVLQGKLLRYCIEAMHETRDAVNDYHRERTSNNHDRVCAAAGRLNVLPEDLIARVSQ